MKTTSIQNAMGLSRLKLFLALSRTPHALLDLGGPGFSALLWLGRFPPAEVAALGLITAFSGYAAVYALNDLIDYQADREKIGFHPPREGKEDLDSVFVRHPVAQEMLKVREGVLWVVAWATLAATGAFLLNPLCAFIFLLACLLEFFYCRLFKVTYMRGIVSGFVKSSGPMAAVFAVDPEPAAPFLIVLFLWLFFWEIGGQNVPNDWGDLDEDRRLGAKTIPVRFGPQGSITIILFALSMSLLMSLLIFLLLPREPSRFYLLGALVCGIFFLLIPGYRLYKRKTAQDAFALFNRASYYPLAMLMVIVLSWFLHF